MFFNLYRLVNGHFDNDERCPLLWDEKHPRDLDVNPKERRFSVFKATILAFIAPKRSHAPTLSFADRVYHYHVTMTFSSVWSEDLRDFVPYWSLIFTHVPPHLWHAELDEIGFHQEVAALGIYSHGQKDCLGPESQAARAAQNEGRKLLVEAGFDETDASYFVIAARFSDPAHWSKLPKHLVPNPEAVRAMWTVRRMFPPHRSKRDWKLLKYGAPLLARILRALSSLSGVSNRPHPDATTLQIAHRSSPV